MNTKRLKFLLGVDLSPKVAAALRADGHEAIHVGDVGLLAEKDEVTLEWAAQHEYVVTTADKDFGKLLFWHRLTSPSVILLRHVAHRPQDSHAALLAEKLLEISGALRAGAIVSLSPKGPRVRHLPICNETHSVTCCVAQSG